MNIISQILLIVVSSAINGTIAFGIWLTFKERLKTWNPDLVYLTLRIVCLFYIIPVGYIALQLLVRDGYLQKDGPWQVNFAFSGIAGWIVRAFGVAWLIFTIAALVRKYIANHEFREVLKGNIPEDDPVAEEEFLRIKKKLHIHRHIRLNRNDLLASPMTIGFLNCRVLLPYKKYNREQLQVILYHELMHYKSQDVFYKLCAIYVHLFQHLSPISDKLMTQLNEWSEYDCDTKAMRIMQDEISKCRYFEVILEVLEKTLQPREEDYIFSMLGEKSNNLGRRVLYMEYCSKVKKVTKGVSFLLVFGFVMVNVTTTYAGGRALVEAQEHLYKQTECLTEESVAERGQQELFISGEEDNSYALLAYEDGAAENFISAQEHDIDSMSVYGASEEGVMPQLNANEIKSFNWSISTGVRHISNTFSVKKGNKIVVSCSVTPSTNTYWLGIMNSNGDVRYISGTGALAHTFDITTGGSYRVIVQNQGSSTITAAGSYYYY